MFRYSRISRHLLTSRCCGLRHDRIHKTSFVHEICPGSRLIASFHVPEVQCRHLSSAVGIDAAAEAKTKDQVLLKNLTKAKIVSFTDVRTDLTMMWQSILAESGLRIPGISVDVKKSPMGGVYREDIVLSPSTPEAEEFFDKLFNRYSTKMMELPVKEGRNDASLQKYLLHKISKNYSEKLDVEVANDEICITGLREDIDMLVDTASVMYNTWGHKIRFLPLDKYSPQLIRYIKEDPQCIMTPSQRALLTKFEFDEAGENLVLGGPPSVMKMVNLNLFNLNKVLSMPYYEKRRITERFLLPFQELRQKFRKLRSNCFTVTSDQSGDFIHLGANDIKTLASIQKVTDQFMNDYQLTPIKFTQIVTQRQAALLPRALKGFKYEIKQTDNRYFLEARITLSESPTIQSRIDLVTDAREILFDSDLKYSYMKFKGRSLFGHAKGNFLSHVLEKDRITIMSYDKEILNSEIEKFSSLLNSLSISEVPLDDPDQVGLLQHRQKDILNKNPDVFWSLDTPGKIRLVGISREEVEGLERRIREVLAESSSAVVQVPANRVAIHTNEKLEAFKAANRVNNLFVRPIDTPKHFRIGGLGNVESQFNVYGDREGVEAYVEHLNSLLDEDVIVEAFSHSAWHKMILAGREINKKEGSVKVVFGGSPFCKSDARYLTITGSGNAAEKQVIEDDLKQIEEETSMLVKLRRFEKMSFHGKELSDISTVDRSILKSMNLQLQNVTVKIDENVYIAASDFNEAGAILAEEHIRELLNSLEWAEHNFGGITDDEKDSCQEKFQKICANLPIHYFVTRSGIVYRGLPTTINYVQGKLEAALKGATGTPERYHGKEHTVKITLDRDEIDILKAFDWYFGKSFARALMNIGLPPDSLINISPGGLGGEISLAGQSPQELEISAGVLRDFVSSIERFVLIDLPAGTIAPGSSSYWTKHAFNLDLQKLQDIELNNLPELEVLDREWNFENPSENFNVMKFRSGKIILIFGGAKTVDEALEIIRSKLPCQISPTRPSENSRFTRFSNTGKRRNFPVVSPGLNVYLQLSSCRTFVDALPGVTHRFSKKQQEIMVQAPHSEQADTAVSLLHDCISTTDKIMRIRFPCSLKAVERLTGSWLERAPPPGSDQAYWVGDTTIESISQNGFAVHLKDIRGEIVVFGQSEKVDEAVQRLTSSLQPGRFSKFTISVPSSNISPEESTQLLHSTREAFPEVSLKMDTKTSGGNYKYRAAYIRDELKEAVPDTVRRFAEERCGDIRMRVEDRVDYGGEGGAEFRFLEMTLSDVERDRYTMGVR